MSSPETIIKNSSVAIIQVLVTGFVLFFLYRYLLDVLGIEQLGIWSIVLATTSLSKISELGFSNSVIKFVAKYIARNEIDKAAIAIETAVITITIILAVILCVLYYPAQILLTNIIPPEGIELGLSILPFAFVSLWINSINANILSGLDGLQRIDLRGIIQIVSNLLYFILAITIIPRYGLPGLALAQIVQALFVLFVATFLLHKNMHGFPLIPHQWSSTLFREMLGYGVNFQITSIMNMLFEPVTKALLSKYGTLSMVGYFEMANRMVKQFRSLIVSVNQVLVPVIAGNHEASPNLNKQIYINSYYVTLYVSMLFFGLILSLIPIISVLWIGKYEISFVVFASMSVAAWFLNTLSTPAYFGNLGSGNLRWNTISHITMTVTNVLLGLLLGSVFSGYGVVSAWVIALCISSFLMILTFNKKEGISLKKMSPTNYIFLFVVCCFAAIVTQSIYHAELIESNSLSLIFSVCVYFLIISFPFFMHPMFSTMKQWIFKKAY